MSGPDPLPEAAVSRSRELFRRAQASLAGGVSTAFRVGERPTPLFFREAHGAHLVDVDGNEYVDFVCGYGPVVLGHAHPQVCAAVARAAARTQQTGGQHEAEVELAERLCRLVPSFELVRLALSGSEAVHAAIRTARAATGRARVVKFAGHYHGWLDGIFVATGGLYSGLPDSAGQPSAATAEVLVAEWGNADALEQIFERAGPSIAAVIMEPIPCNQGVFYPPEGYLEHVLELTTRHGSLLIFDEVITGFRLGLGGAQERIGVTPDLSVVAKAMANGFPVSAFGGRRELMSVVARNEAVHAGTFNGGGISVAAAIATLTELESNPSIYRRMEALGARLMEGLEGLAASHGFHLRTRGPGPVFFAWFTSRDDVVSFEDHLSSDASMYARFAELMIGEGIRIIPGGRWYLTAAHEKMDIEHALAAADRVLQRLREEGQGATPKSATSSMAQ